MKRVVQCGIVLYILFVIYFWNMNRIIIRDLYELKNEVNDLETEVEKIEDNIGHTKVEHTKVDEVGFYTEDTEDQIVEEIRLGEMEMLAQLIHAEAGGEDLEGKRLVADVVLNRYEAGWGDSIEAVIFQTLSNGVAQFSTTQDGAYDNAGWEMTETDYLAAQMEYEATQRLDDKIMYFRSGTWSAYGKKAYRHGGHYFSYE